MRRLQGILLLLAATSTAACLPFGQRSNARVAELEATSRAGGATATLRTEIDYLSDGRIDEITRTQDGDFVDRWELSYGDGQRVEELVIISDEQTVTVELSYTGDLLTEARARDADDAQDIRWDLSYFNGDARFIESVVLTMDSDSSFVEVATEYVYDDRSRIEEIETTSVSESALGTTSESTMTNQLRWDADTGRLERITTTTETPHYPPTESDPCWDAGWYGDGVCDSICPQPDPDCGGASQPIAPGPGEPELRKDTFLYSVKYDDEGRLEEMDGPGGAAYTVDYDEKGRIEEVEERGDGYTFSVEYTYDEGEVRGHSFSPALPNGKFFDLLGASFGTLPFDGPLTLVQSLGGVSGAAAPSDGGL